MAASEAAITGLGMTSLGRVYGSSPRRLAASALRLAAADAGLALSDIDGLLICPGITGGLDMGLAGVLGLRDLALLAVVNSFGASAVMAVQVAAQAISAGSARAVACVFADTPLREGVPAGSAFGRMGGASGPEGPPERLGLGGLAAGYGFRNVSVYYALAARRHMERFGTSSEQFGAIAVAQRRWAAGNPRAQHRDPMTVADHQRSRWVAEPLHLLDCSLVSNGAIAVIVAPANAAPGPRPPVHIWGWGQGHPGQPMARGSEFGLVTGATQAGRAAMGMAGIAPADVTMCQLYDCYTYTVLVTLEDYGFCAKGEGGPFAASGALAPGGALPVNTGGGQLSAYYMWGFTPLSEAIIQARRDGGDRQAPSTDVILVSGNGGILSHHGTLILSPHRRTAGVLRTGRDLGGRSAASEPGRDEAAANEPATKESAAEARTGVTAATPANGEARIRPALEGPENVGVVRPDARSAPFFAAAADGVLMIRRCADCGTWLAPTATGCPECGEDAELTWAVASGRGALVTWSLVHPRNDGPVAVPALVELAEGPWLATGLRLADAAELTSLRAGLDATAEFVHPADGESYPVFRPELRP